MNELKQIRTMAEMILEKVDALEGAKPFPQNGFREFVPEDDREWHSGPPPHIGWWNASANKTENHWRWWNGKHWGSLCFPICTPENVTSYAKSKEPIKAIAEKIKWTHYWPENARVPRIDPKDVK